MSGHNKWSTIKHKKAKQDAIRGRIFTRLIKEITLAAKEGGGDPDANARLRNAIAAAKAANMPSDNIERAIKKGTGELPGVVYEEITYEAYGPGGVAMIIEVVTDNKNRSAAEVRHTLDKHGGKLGAQGSVTWMFEKWGIIEVKDNNVNEEELFEKSLDAGAEDMYKEGDVYIIKTEASSLDTVKTALENAGFEITKAEITKIPQNTTSLTGNDAEKMLKLMNALDELDDVQNVYANFDISDEEMDRIVEKL